MKRVLVILTLVCVFMTGLVSTSAAQEFDPNLYTCQQFNADAQTGAQAVGFAILWAFGWIDKTTENPTMISEDRITTFTQDMMLQCTNNPQSSFIDAVNAVIGE